MRGRKPVPTALKVLRGNPGKRALSQDEPEPPPLADDATPPTLSDEARLEWAELAPALSAVGLLTSLDAKALAQLCETSVMLAQAREDYEGHRCAETRAAVLRLQEEERKLLVEFGMTPSSRTRVKASGAKKQANRFASVAGATG